MLNTKRWISPKEFYEEFSISISTQSKMRSKGHKCPLPHVKVGGFVKYDRYIIDDFFERHTVVSLES